MAAERMGQEAALFVASGTMANIICQMVHCGRGDEMILGDQSHIFFYEQGGSAALGGIHPRTLPNQPDGTISPDAIASAIRADDVHFPRSRLLVLENTHNRCNGNPLTLAYLETIGRLARTHNLKLHIDGARIFNAATALDVAPSELTAQADSVSFCLSKGLAAPAGSLVCGAHAFVHQARRVRKVLGGGMRQAGILAAAGIVALTQMVDRLAEDHANAQKLAHGLAAIDGLRTTPENVKTNIVYIDITQKNLNAADLVARLQAKGVRLLPTDTKRMRAVTNYHISTKDIDKTLDTFRAVL
jgi:threonine aldolase